MKLSETILKYYDLPTRFFVKSWKDFYARLAVKLYCKALEAGDTTNPRELETFSYERARQFLEYVSRNVSHWRILGQRRPSSLKDFASFWESLPLTSRLYYKNTNSEIFLNQNVYFKSTRRSYFTSGTTGVPLEFYYEPYRYEIHHAAAIYYALERMGAPIENNRSIVTTFFTVFEGSYAKFKLIYDLLETDISSGQLPDYGREFSQFIQHFSSMNSFDRPIFIMRPSQAFLLAHWVKDRNIDFGLPFLLVVGENLHEERRKFIEGVFRCPVRMIYSTKELSIMGFECPKNLGLIHTFPESHLMELVDERGNKVGGYNEEGNLLITSFVNLTMPFIRYQVGDRAVAIKPDGPCACGSSRPLIKLIGRDSQEIEINNNVVSFITLDYLLCYDRVHKIRQLQFLWESARDFRLKLAVNDLFTKKDELSMLIILRKALGNESKFIFEYCDFIPPEPSGKFINFKVLI